MKIINILKKTTGTIEKKYQTASLPKEEGTGKILR